MMLRVLPNRYIALMMTPREASMLEGQILDPEQFPWQDSETHVVGTMAKSMLHEAVAEMVARELDASISAITQMGAMAAALQREEEGEDEATDGVVVCPNCKDGRLVRCQDPNCDGYICPNCQSHYMSAQDKAPAEEESESLPE